MDLKYYIIGIIAGLLFVYMFVAIKKPRTYRLLVSAQCRPYQDWQSVGVWWSARKNWPAAKYTRLLSCTESAQSKYKYQYTVPSFYTSDWAKHPTTNDDYAPYNRPVSIKEYLETVTPEEEYMVIIDPDTIICKSLADIKVSKGRPVAQRYDYLNNDNALQLLADRFGIKGDLQPLGMPMIIHRNDLSRLAPVWLDLTEKIRNDPESKKLAGWIAEMHSYCLAAAKVGLKHSISNELADRTPYKRLADPYVLHYDLRHDCKDFTWDKRDYLNTDLLNSNTLMPIPLYPPNKRFLKVFETLNEALKERSSFKT